MGERGGCGCERVRRGWTWVWLEVGRLGLMFCAGGKVCGGKKGDGLRYPDTATKDQRRSILCSKDEYIFAPWKVRNYLLSYDYMSTRGRALRWTQPLHWGLFEEATPGRVKDSKMSYASIWERMQYSSPPTKPGSQREMSLQLDTQSSKYLGANGLRMPFNAPRSQSQA